MSRDRRRKATAQARRVKPTLPAWPETTITSSNCSLSATAVSNAADVPREVGLTAGSRKPDHLHD